MKITRCSGVEVHFFDKEKYPVCPICGSSAATAENQEVKDEQPKKGLFSNWGKNKNRPEDYTVKMEEEKCVEYEEQRIPREDSTIDKLVPNIPEAPKPVDVEDAQDVKPNMSVMDTEKTIGVFTEIASEPVVGWIVCVKGESQGESFNLKAGRNSIGRGNGMDIMLGKERSVSRDKHAIITYEPKKRNFFIQLGDGNGLVYVNDELVMSYTELKAHDLVQLGNAYFIFIPLCGENFVWDDYMYSEDNR